MNEEKKATEANAVSIAPQEKSEAEMKIEALEAEKAQLLEEKVNYKMAYLKEVNKDRDPNESEEERLRRIIREETATSRISAIDKEKEDLLKKTLRENSELKRTFSNKPDVPASNTVHSEGQRVTDTIITPEQLAQFKAMGKDDKWIENYKKNLRKNMR